MVLCDLGPRHRSNLLPACGAKITLERPFTTLRVPLAGLSGGGVASGWPACRGYPGLRPMLNPVGLVSPQREVNESKGVSQSALLGNDPNELRCPRDEEEFMTTERPRMSGRPSTPPFARSHAPAGHSTAYLTHTQTATSRQLQRHGPHSCTLRGRTPTWSCAQHAHNSRAMTMPQCIFLAMA